MGAAGTVLHPAATGDRRCSWSGKALVLRLCLSFRHVFGRTSPARRQCRTAERIGLAVALEAGAADCRGRAFGAVLSALLPVSMSFGRHLWLLQSHCLPSLSVPFGSLHHLRTLPGCLSFRSGRLQIAQFRRMHPMRSLSGCLSHRCADAAGTAKLHPLRLPSIPPESCPAGCVFCRKVRLFLQHTSCVSGKNIVI